MRDQAIAVMREVGIDISGQRPKPLSEMLSPELRLLVGLCAEEACPVVPGVPSLQWPIANPAGGPITAFRAARDELSRRIRDLVANLSNLA